MRKLLASLLFILGLATSAHASYWNSWPPSYQPLTYPEACQGYATNLGNGTLYSMVPDPDYYFNIICYYGYTPLQPIKSDKTSPHDCPAGTVRTNRLLHGCEQSPVAGKKLGGPQICAQGVGNPCDITSGNKFQAFVDFPTSGANRLGFTRFYNARTSAVGRYQNIGVGWTSNFGLYLEFDNWQNPTIIRAYRPDGKVLTFTKSGGVFNPDKDVTLRIAGASPNWTVTDENDTVEVYYNNYLNSITYRDSYKQTVNWNFVLPYTITSVTDSHGRSMVFNYITDSTTGRKYMTSMTAPDNTVYGYNYNFANGNLTKAIFPGTTAPSQTYHYEMTSILSALTGITDEKGIRFATWTYDANGRMLTSQHAGGADLTTIAYSDSDGTRTVTNALGQQFKYYTGTVTGVLKLTKIDRLASATVPAAQMLYGYDANGFVNSITDWNGNVTKYTYDARGLETSRTEAFGTALARTITTTWNSTYHLPTQIVAPGKTTTFTYTSGLLTQKTETDTTTNTIPYSTNGRTRNWTYTYTPTGGAVPAGLLASVNGPRTDVSDVTLFGYDSSGNLISVTNPLGQASSLGGYDGRGLPHSVTDLNGVVSTLSYNPRGWLTGISTATTAGNAVTTIDYDDVGQVTKITGPDGAFFTYSYDTARRLTRVGNNLDQRIDYTRDAIGGWTQLQIRTAGGAALVKTQQRTFDALGRVLTSLGASSQTTTYLYDANSNLIVTTDPLTRQTTQAFDALNRLIQVTDAATNNTILGYDNRDNLTGLTDSRSLVTAYVYDGLGNVTQLTSPDTGVTVYQYDAAGNRTQQTDAAGVVTNFAYDALNRVIAKTYPATPAQNIAYAYDGVGVPNGVGRLTSLTDPSGSTAFEYDQLGNVAKTTKTIGGNAYVTLYAHDLASRLSQITYPSGRLVLYARDTLGRVSGVTTKANAGAPSVAVATGIAYLPFGPATGWLYGNGLTLTRTFDQDYRLTALQANNGGAITIQDLQYGYDLASTITGITDNRTPARSQTFQYDPLYRLTQAVGAYGTFTYSYDSVGNRLTRALAGSGAFSETYAYAGTSNRLLTVTNAGVVRTLSYDATGNVSGDDPGGGGPIRTLSYTPGQRLSQVATGSPLSAYTYDAFEQRVAAAAGGATTQFVFDFSGMPLAEYDGAGALQREYINLEGEAAPIALVAAGTLAFIHTDHLGTVQAITDGSAVIVWEGVYRPFGHADTPVATLPNNLRFPGQYRDAATGYHQNWFRDYDPSLGRYLQSDPIGLAGGINIYGYVGGNPVNLSDSKGQNPAILTCVVPAQPVCVSGLIVGGVTIIIGIVVLNEATKDSGKGTKNGEVCPVTPPKDPAQPPAEGWVWKGSGPSGNKKGAWVNPNTGESLHPDLDHPGPLGPHWDYNRPGGGKGWRVPPGGGVMAPKK